MRQAITVFSPVIIAAIAAPASFAVTADFEDIAPTSYSAGQFDMSQGVFFTNGPLSGSSSNCCTAVTSNGSINGSQELIIDSLMTTFYAGSASVFRIDYGFLSEFQETALEIQLSDGTFYSGDVAALPAPFVVDGSPHKGTITYDGPDIAWFGIGGVDMAIDNVFIETTDGTQSADLNHDRAVDAGDARILFEQWTGDAALAFVPEPIMGYYGALCALALARCRRTASRSTLPNC